MFDLVISDVDMAPMDGVELLRAVRQDAALANICFVLMTALKSSESVIAAKKLGVDAFLLKPFSLDVLKEKLARLEKLQERS